MNSKLVIEAFIVHSFKLFTGGNKGDSQRERNTDSTHSQLVFHPFKKKKKERIERK